MKSFSQYYTILFAIVTFSVGTVNGQKSEQTQYPYFQILSENATVESMPLKSSKAEVDISGVIADVTIHQTFRNEGIQPIEAIYVFPGSTQAAVYNMEMKVNDQVIKAVIQEKAKARATFKKAKLRGKRASLLEQNRPNVFTMNVANILPGDEITVTLKYTESLVPLEGVYTFVYPGVVGPRYASIEDVAPTAGVPYETTEDLPTFESTLDIHLSTGMPIQDITSQSHEIIVDYEGLGQASVGLHKRETNASNRDFIMSYQLSGDRIDTGLLLYESEEENHFMLTVQPPAHVSLEDIPNREYIFVVDVSGSMNGFPSRVAQKLMRNLLTNLRPDDLFNVLLFASSSSIYSPSSVAVENQEIEKAISFIQTQRNGGGGTRLMNALTRVLELPKCNAGLSRSIVVVTDGYISVEKDVYDLIRGYQNEFNFFSFGIGKSVNRYLIEGIANIGNSEPLIITSMEEASVKAEQFRKYIASPVLTDISLDWNGFEVYDIEPEMCSDVFVEKPVVISGKYKGEPQGLIELSGIAGKQKYTAYYDVSSAQPSIKNEALKYLWARERIKKLDDYIKVEDDSKNKSIVTELGLKYNLLTNYTSFVAVDEQETFAKNLHNDPNKEVPSVKQTLPTPEGVTIPAIPNNQPVYSMGAELQISGEEDARGHTLKYSISGDNLSEMEVLFLELELANILNKISKTKDLNILCGRALDVKIGTDGSMTIIDLKNGKLASGTFRKLRVALEKQTFTFRKNKPVHFKISFS